MKKQRPFLARVKEKIWLNNKFSNANGSYGDLTVEQWLKILADSQGFCCYCDKYIGIELLTMDHIIPSGATTVSNIVAACRSCNSKKGQKMDWKCE